MRSAAPLLLALVASTMLPAAAAQGTAPPDPSWGGPENLVIGSVTARYAVAYWDWTMGCSAGARVVLTDSRNGQQTTADIPAFQGQMQHPFHDLEPEVDYSVRVGNNQSCGIGGHMPLTIDFRTKALGPPGHATNVSVDSITTSTAVVHWTWVSGCDDGLVDILAMPRAGPAVRDGSPGTSSFPPADPAANPRQATLDRLWPGTDYDVRIEPRDRCGQCCAPAPQVAFRTQGDTPPDPSLVIHEDPHMGWGENLTVRPGRTSATFQWDWTVGCSPMVELRVYPDVAGERGGVPEVTLRLDASTDGLKQARADGLRPGTTYWAIVLVTSNCGIAGGSTDFVRFTTAEAGRTELGAAWSLGALAVGLALAFAVRLRR